MTTSNAPESTDAQLRAFEAHYDYDAGYLRRLLELAPNAYGRFAAAQGMSQHRDALSQDAHAIACISVMLTDDCGACAQLNLRMAAEVGVPRDLLQTLLDEPAELPKPLDDVYHHARAVTAGDPLDAERVTRLRDAIGDQAFGELAVVITGARIYPSLKRAMGTTTHCRKPSLDF